MTRIIHLTDFHLNPINLRDWNDYVKQPLIDKLTYLHNETPIDIIAFTGDMIDKAGKNYKSSTEAFNLFNEEVIKPIINELHLSINNFLIVPGNHDVLRSKDKKRDELGSIEFFKERENIVEFMQSALKNNDFSGMLRIEEYKAFEKSLYPESLDTKLSIFGSSFKFTFNNETVGVCCLNSAWRSYDNCDKERLIIGEDQLIGNYKFISKCSIKIALMHHPLDWLTPVERSIITRHINKDFDLLLIGHTHESMTTIQTGFFGSLFVNVAPSGLNDIRSDSRTFANGFTLIDFDKRGKTVRCEYLRYNHSNKMFVINTDAGDNGYFMQSFPNPVDAKKEELLKTVISNIKEDHFAEMDNHLIGVKANKENVSLKDGFILPPINQGNYVKEEDGQDKNVNITDIVKSISNQIFFGSQESGKTTLLYRLVREFIDEYDYLRKIPVYINIDDLGHKDVIPAIKEYLRCGTNDAKYLLEHNYLVLLIDNLSYIKNGDIHRHYKINKFNIDYESVQIIATANNNVSGILPPDYIDLCTIPFRTYFIRSLRTKEIKSIMKLWSPTDNEIKTDERLDKLVNSFNSFALPSTAMSVSLFLWSLDNKERKPINQAVLLEIYIEIILEKLSKDNIYRDKFDFTNKVQLLAKIANEMLLKDQPNYSILYSEFLKIIEDYLKKDVGFDFDAKVISEYFIERRIFLKHQENRIKFSYTCFFHFFIAKRMEYNSEFRTYVMDESRYYLYNNEINYYTGLVRSDEDLFKEVFLRFEKNFKPTDFISEIVDIDKHFSELGEKPHEPISKNVEISKIKENRPSDELIERFYNKRLEKIPDPCTILKKEGRISLEMMLVIMSNVLRNSEGVENIKLKKQAYYSLIKYSMIWMILYRESLINYVLKNKKLPPSIPYEYNLEYLLKFIPYHVQHGMLNHLGTAKLSPIILEKIKDDIKNEKRPDIEAFLSVALYSDIEGTGFPKFLMKFVKNVGNNIVRDYILFKLLNYYYRRTREGSPNEQTYIDIIAELRIRSQKLPQRMRERVIKSIEDGKRLFKKKNIE